MGHLFEFIKNLYEKFLLSEKVLSKILKEEELLKNNVLVKKGFIIKKYSVKIDSINLGGLKKLKEGLERINVIENEIDYDIKENRKNIRELENSYNAYYNDNLDLETIFKQQMNNVFYLSKLAVVRIDELIKILAGLKSQKLYSQNLGKNVKKVIDSLERMTGEIMRFISLLEQLVEKFENFTKQTYYSDYKNYGRAMSKREAKETKALNKLVGSVTRKERDLIGVFDSSDYVKKRIILMNEDERKNFFGSIGVVSGIEIVFFRTKLRPVNADNPIPQSNGLKEYKFPKGIPIEISEAA